VGLAIAVVLAAGACAGGRISLGTDASACFRDLPPANDAVHTKGKLVGVRREGAATLRARLPHDTTLATLPDQDLCVFAFTGTYPAGSVTGAHNTVPRHYAIVAVGTKNTEVVAAFVSDQLPTRFKHLH
jgi:hypothetical protein